MPVPMLTACQLDAFICALRTRVLDREEGFSKRYGRNFVSEIRCDAKRIAMQKKAPLISAAVQKKGTTGVPSSVHNWLLDLGSNQGPTD